MNPFERQKKSDDKFRKTVASSKSRAIKNKKEKKYGWERDKLKNSTQPSEDYDMSGATPGER